MSEYESPGCTRMYPRIIPRVSWSRSSSRFRRAYSGKRKNWNAASFPPSVPAMSAAAARAAPAAPAAMSPSECGFDVTAISIVSSSTTPFTSVTNRVTEYRPCCWNVYVARDPTSTPTKPPWLSAIRQT